MKNRMIPEKWLIGLSFMFFPCFAMFAQEASFETEFPIELSLDKGTSTDLIIYLTGDGGWNKFSKNLVNEFEKEGYGVVSLNSLKYFRSEKSPTVFAHDLGFLSEHYLKEWNKTSIIIVGYSFGADVASFLPGYFSSELKEKIKKVVLLSPSASTDFVIRISDLLGFSDNEDGKFLIRKKIEKSKLPVVCIFGEKESLLLKKFLENDDLVSVYELPGNHNYDDNFKGLVKIIVA